MSGTFYFGGTTIYLNFNVGPPMCPCGRGAIAGQLPDGSRVCPMCVEEFNRKTAIARAENWLTAAFYACPREQRQRLYRSLAAVFHPDAGGDAHVMEVLNAVKERFP